MGAVDHLPKTVDPEILRARIEASLARKRLHDVERAASEAAGPPARDHRPPARPSCRASCRRRSPPSSRATTARRCWPAIGARSPRCSATCASSPSSPRRPSRRRCSASCAPTTALMGPLIVEHEGTLEHFAGDGFMTFFNDPVPQPDHAERAVRLALAMREHFAPLSAEWARHGYALELGIGIATGYATLGRIGFEGRYDYGAVGRVIIHAARLSADAAPGEILIAQRHAGRDRRAWSTWCRPVTASSRASLGRSRPSPSAASPATARRRSPHDRAGHRRGRLRASARDHRRRPRVRRRAGRHVPRRRRGQVAALRGRGAGDTRGLVRPAHTLKSSSANVGALALAEACRVLEAEARTGTVADRRGPRVDHRGRLRRGQRTRCCEARAGRG